ncbi:MAG: ribosome small subunit-dependent GTPase A [Thermoanaerobacteraceae bacterium]|nr:ribosome small subunit-dependent GTPase A [Thermoanaerobacteraceae bacterium]
MREGILIKGVGGFYFVLSEGKIYRCRLRGRLRVKAGEILVGDRVQFKETGLEEGAIEAVLPRVTKLERPAVANIDQVIVVFSLREPPPDLELLDRLLVLSMASNAEPIICWNKADIASEEFLSLPSLYESLGYRVLVTSARTGQGVDLLREVLQGHVSTFAGPSGVGKSSLLNAVEPGLNLKTGEVSRKQGRGRHTTRQVELLLLKNGGIVADTPGFSKLNLPEMKREDLAAYFPEILAYEGECRFHSCLHRSEPDCAVRKAVEEGGITRNRYAHYLKFLEEVIETERSY